MLLLRPRSLPTGFIPPCLSTAAPTAPSGDPVVREIKHDGIRVIARKEDKRVKLYSRPGNDLTRPFPQIVRGAGASALPLALLGKMAPLNNLSRLF